MKKNKSSKFFNLSRQSTLDKYFSLNDECLKMEEKIKNFIKTTTGKINILKSFKTKCRYNIMIPNNSLIEIFNKMNNKMFYLQDFIKLIIISEIKNTISLELNESYKYINIINKHKSYEIDIKNSNEYNEKKIKILKKSLIKIFKYIKIKSLEQIFNFLEITLYDQTTTYQFEDNENLLEKINDIYNNSYDTNNFYISNTNNKKFMPLSNYSIKKIFNMIKNDENNDKNNNYCIVKLKNENDLKFDEKNKTLLNKLLIKNYCRYLYEEYPNEVVLTDKLKISEKNNSLIRQIKPNIIQFNNALFSAEDLINDILLKVSIIKNEFNKRISNENNYFICIKDINNNNKYINNQYLKIINKKSIDYNQKDTNYIFSFILQDYSGQNINISINKDQLNNYLSKPLSEKYIGIINNKKHYLVKVDSFQNLLKNWNVLSKKYKFNIEYPSKEVKEFSLNKIIIDEYKKIDDIEGKIYKENKSINNESIKNEKNDKEDIKNNDDLFKKISFTEKKKSRNTDEIKIDKSFHFHRREKTDTELLYNDTYDTDNRNNKSMYLLNMFGAIPEKDSYTIRRVVKVIKKDKKKKDKNDKKIKKIKK